MARPNNNIGVFGDLNLGGTDNTLLADFRWRGDAATEGTASLMTVAYSEGQFVVHNGHTWVALRDSDNIEPGGTMDTAATIAGNGFWNDLGDTNVVTQWANDGATPPVSTSGYETGNLVYVVPSGQLFVALRAVPVGTGSPDTNPMTTDTPPVPYWLRVGGAPITAGDGIESSVTNGVQTLSADLGDGVHFVNEEIAVEAADASISVAAGGISVNLDPDATNGLESDDTGLHSRTYNLSSEMDGDNATLTLNGLAQDTANNTADAVSFAAATAAMAADGAGVTQLAVSENGDTITFTGPYVAGWAQNETGGVTIPRSKLPNVELGNTHTFASDADPAAGELVAAAVANAGGQRDGDDPIAWHPGDLLVLAGTAPDDGNNGIYVFVGADQGIAPVSPLPGTGTPMEIFEANFRAVVSVNTELQTTLTSFEIDGATGDRSTTALGSLNSVNYSAGGDVLELVGSGGTRTVNQSERQPDNVAGVGGFINHIKIGGVIYRFGPTPPLPTYSMSPSTASVNLYRSDATSVDFDSAATQQRNNADGTTTANVPNVLANEEFNLASGTGAMAPAGDGAAVDMNTGVFTIPAATGEVAGDQEFPVFSSGALDVRGQSARTVGTGDIATGVTFSEVVIQGDGGSADSVITPFGGDAVISIPALGDAANGGEADTSVVANITGPGSATALATLYAATEAHIVTFQRRDAGGTITDAYRIIADNTQTDASLIPQLMIQARGFVPADATNIQVTAGATWTVTANATITDVNIADIMYDTNDTGDDTVDAATALITTRDARDMPVARRTTAARHSVLSTTPPAFSVALNNTDTRINAGTGYDIAGVTIGTTAGGLPTTAIMAGTNGVVTYTDPALLNSTAYGTVVTDGANPERLVNYRFIYPMVANPRHSQPATAPDDDLVSVTYYRPWGVITAAAVPTTSAQVTALMPTSDDVFMSRDVNNISVSGTAGDTIFLAIPTTDLTGETIANYRLVGVGQPFNSTLAVAGTVTVDTGAAGTTIDYTILQAGATLPGSSLTINFVHDAS